MNKLDCACSQVQEKINLVACDQTFQLRNVDKLLKEI